MRHCFFAIAFFIQLKILASPLSIVIIGGGPSGLATAIEASENGNHVVVVEKRPVHSRFQWLFLSDFSLGLLEKWQVTIPQMRIADFGSGSNEGLVQIRHLEEQLEKRAIELGVTKIYGKFLDLKEGKVASIVDAEGNELLLSYDIIVGADGLHSCVRRVLDIKQHCFGCATGTYASIFEISEEDAKETDLAKPIKSGCWWLKKIHIPFATVIFAQSCQETSEQQFLEAIRAQGWIKEGQCIEENRALVLTSIPVLLRQAETFVSKEKAAILVGDAAASASFFQGEGVNTALHAAAIAGVFFKEVQRDCFFSYEDFDQAMKTTTDLLIRDNICWIDPVH